MPTTRVEKIRGASIILIILRNISARGWSIIPNFGQSKPTSIPSAKPANIYRVNFDFFFVLPMVLYLS